MFESLKPRIDALVAAGHPPGLATVLVGNDGASAGYVRVKHAKCAELGPRVVPRRAARGRHPGRPARRRPRLQRQPAVSTPCSCSTPSPRHLDYEAALHEMDPDKDADGLHPVNLGRLALSVPGPVPRRLPASRRCWLTTRSPSSGRHVVILGRGFTLGRPLSMLLSQKRPTANAAVTVVHTGVPNWGDYARQADILIAAAGVPGIVQPEHINPGSVVIGGGVRYEGRKLLPDVDEACAEVAGWITPRVGGVGPTTIAMLFRNLVEAAERRGRWLTLSSSAATSASGTGSAWRSTASASRSPRASATACSAPTARARPRRSR